MDGNKASKGLAGAAVIAAFSALTYFSAGEFAQKNDASGDTGLMFDTATAQMLDSARKIASVPFIINSGIRTPDYNESVGGALKSSHTAPCYCAVDIRTGGIRRVEERVLKGLKGAGFIRIIIYPRHIHADTDSSKSRWGVWHSNYKSKK